MKPKNLLLLFITIAAIARPFSLPGQAIIIGYSDVFKIGNEMHEYPNIIGYSGVFDMNTRGQYFEGYSGLFLLNTIGGIIKGEITDSQTGLPIQNATVQTMGYTSPPSNQQGLYELHVPFGLGYQVSAMAKNYETETFGNIHVTVGNPVVTMNFQLVPGEFSPILTILQPNPNPAISTVQQGGKLHRYYKITNLPGLGPWPAIPVTVVGTGFLRTYLSDTDGIVDIYINSNEIGYGQVGAQASFTITEVNNQFLDEPVSFLSEVEKQEYGKYWDTQKFLKLGVSFFEFTGKSGASVSLLGYDASNSLAESIKLKRQEQAKIGVEFSVGVELGVQCGNLVAGGGLNASYLPNLSIKTEDFYKLDRISASNDDEAIARYILFTSGLIDHLDPVLVQLLTISILAYNNQFPLNQAYEGDRKTVELGIEGNLEAEIGIGDMNSFGLGISGNFGTEAKIGFDFLYNHYKNEKEIALEYNGKFATQGKSGINMGMSIFDPVTGSISSKVFVNNSEMNRGVRFAITRDLAQNGSPLKEMKITFLNRFIENNNGWQEGLTYNISGDDFINAIQNLQNPELLNHLINLPDGSIFTISSDSFKILIEIIFNLANDIQSNANGAASIDFEQHWAEIQTSNTYF